MSQLPPRWAVAATRAMDSLRELSYWWYHRQDPDTGIGFEDDDVESILVSAPTLVLGQGDERAKHAFYAVTEQMWRQWGMDGDVEVGYPTNIETGDIEHAAEPISFSQPNMAIVDPGNPKYIERCLISMRNLLYWTAINKAGHRHFKAFYFGAGGVKTAPYYDCDIPMNARAVIPGVYAAWYNHDEVMMRYLREYADAWVEHAMDTSMGKPVGVVPSEIRFEDDKVGGYSGRWDQIAGYRQFDWSSYHRSAYNMYYFFISMYLLTGDGRYLEPVRETVKHLAATNGPKDAAGYGAMYRSYTARTDLDYLFVGLTREEPLWRWFLSGDKTALADWCESMADNLEESMEIRTTKLDLRDACSNYDTCVDDSVLRLMYNGGLGHQVGAYPFIQVSWLGADAHFAALVLSADSTALDVLAYNSGVAQRDVAMMVWNLEPGTYAVAQGPDNNQDDAIDGSPTICELPLARWSKVPITLPPGSVWKIEIRQVRADSQPSSLPDLAICVDDVLCSPPAPHIGDLVELTVTVHNIGSADAQDVVVTACDYPSGDPIWKGGVAKLTAPAEFEPSRAIVSFPWQVKQRAEGVEIHLSLKSGGAEITTTNNRVRVALSDLRDELWAPNVHIYTDPPPGHPLEAVAVRRTAPPGSAWSVGDPDWYRAPVSELAVRMYNDAGVVANPTQVRLSYDDANLYIWYSCSDPDPDSLQAVLTEPDSRVWDDESVELTIDPGHNHEFYYHFAVNCIGTRYGAEMVSPFWNGRWDVSTHRDPDGWLAQFTLPFKTLGISPHSGDVTGINFIRTSYADADRGDRQTSIWQKIPQWTLRPAYFGHLRFE